MLLETQNVCKKYAKHTALDNVSIRIPEHSIFGLLGPNGAGKTTLIRIINQITAPDSGVVLFDGRALKRDDVAAIGYLPEERGLYKKMKVGDQAIYLAQLKGLSRSEARKRLRFWFEKMQIMPWWDKKVRELSKGMAQKVQFITTVLHEPRLLIFDEPFSGFDPINTNIIKKEILELKEKGSTIIFSAHDMVSVEAVCDHIALIDKSRKILDGDIYEIKERYKDNTYTLRYVGDLDEDRNGFELLDVKKSEKGETIAIAKIIDSGKANLLQQLSQQVELKEFKEIIPSMNDVFIKAVEENSNKSEKS